MLMKNQVLLWIILALGLVARMRFLGEIEHNVDHAYTVWQAMQSLDRGQFPLIGQGTSVLFANPPAMGYLLMPVVFLTRSPLGVYVMIVGLNWLAIWMAYRAVRIMLNPQAGLIAAGLMAVNPWLIEYSRTAWVQGLLPFFVTAVAWLLWPLLLRQTQRPFRRTVLAAAMTALLIQTYLLAYLILAPVGLLIVIYRKVFPRKALVIGTGLVTVTIVLYGIGLLGEIETVRERLDSFSSGSSQVTTEAWKSATRLITGADYALARGLSAPIQDSGLRHDLSQIFHYGLILALLMGIGVAIRQVWRGDRRGLILLIWFFVPIIAMSYTSAPVHTFYQLLGIPAGYALAAWGLTVLLKPLRARTASSVLLALGLPFAGLMLTNSARYYQETETIPGAHELYALPVDYGMQLGAAIDRHLPEDGIVYARAEEWIVNSFAGRLFSSIPDVRMPAFSVVPANGGLYVHIGAEDAPLPHYATRVEAIHMPDDTFLYVDALPRAEDVEPDGVELDVPSQQGVRLLRYRLEQSAEGWILTLVWQVEFVAPEVQELIYSPFVHVFDSNGEPVLNVSGEGLAGFMWSVGDLHIHQIHLQLPDDGLPPYSVRVGQFDGLHNQNIIFLPADAEPDVTVLLPEQIE